MLYQSGIVSDAVFDRYHVVVRTVQDEGGWRVALDLFLIGVFGLQGLVGRLAQQVVVRAHVGERWVHRDDRIEKDLEVGPGRGVGEMGRGGAGQVSPGRRAHDPQFLDVPLGGVLAHDPQGLLGVAQGHLVVPVGHPIAQHGVGDAHPVHPVRHHRPLPLALASCCRWGCRLAIG